MTRRSSVSRGQRLTGLVVLASALAVSAFGCGETPAPNPVAPPAPREAESTKNMENFMKNAPPPPKAAAPKVQTK